MARVPSARNRCDLSGRRERANRAVKFGDRTLEGATVGGAAATLIEPGRLMDAVAYLVPAIRSIPGRPDVREDMQYGRR